MTLTFDIHIGSCTHLVNCIYQLWYYHIFNSFWKIHWFTFFLIRKHKGTNLTLSWNRSWSTQDHYLNKLGSTHPPNAAYQVSRSSAFVVPEKKILKVFTIYGHGRHLSHVTRTIWANFRFPIPHVPRRLHIKFGFNRPSGFRGEDVWKCWRTTDGAAVS